MRTYQWCARNELADRFPRPSRNWCSRTDAGEPGDDDGRLPSPKATWLFAALCAVIGFVSALLISALHRPLNRKETPADETVNLLIKLAAFCACFCGEVGPNNLFSTHTHHRMHTISP